MYKIENLKGRRAALTTMALTLSVLLGGQAGAGELPADLTPVGAERAGNAAGTIPAWSGGDMEVPAGWKTGDPRKGKYDGEAKLFSINASNVDQYAANLTEGQIAMIKTYDGYRMDVYPSHRSCGYPQSVYDRTKANIDEAKLGADGGILAGHGGFLFPMPKNGLEALANHRTAYHGQAMYKMANMAVVQSNGSFVLNTGEIYSYSSFFNANASATSDPYKSKFIYRQKEPVASIGGMIMTLEPYNGANESWVYIPGLRRVKKAPTATYDNPVAGQDGLRTFDQTYMYNGLPDRYDWTLKGKQEIYVPYNSEKMRGAGVTVADIVGPKYSNRDLARYELHRVWVVEGIAKPEYRATFSRRVFYIDEDQWTILQADLYDSKGALWRTQENHTFMAPEVPACVSAGDFYYDLNAGRYVADEIVVGSGTVDYAATNIVDEDLFSPNGMRRIGRR
tara:strand:+ start:235498 stop:236850 length:1353 start_codon:yes stop_codon:yes gene_type:complete